MTHGSGGAALPIESAGAYRFKDSRRQKLAFGSRSLIAGAEFFADSLTNLRRADLHIKAGKKVESGRLSLGILENKRTELYAGPELIGARFSFDRQTRGKSSLHIINQQFELLAWTRSNDQWRDKWYFRRPVPLPKSKKRIGAHQAKKNIVIGKLGVQLEKRFDGVVGHARRLGSIHERDFEAGFPGDSQAGQFQAVVKAG